MKISACVQNSEGRHEATVSTSGQAQQIPIPPKPSGFGSAANGSELLFLALATCYCNDIYREASKRGIVVH
jgi:organic hydroperoxide reductase OsmC/OhrA